MSGNLDMAKTSEAFGLLVSATSGAVVLSLEVLGPRMLSPILGSSIAVWSGVLVATMMCLALGCYGGGRYRGNPKRAVLLALGGAGAWCFLLAYLGRGIVGALVSCGLSHPVLLCLATFGVPFILLGMCSPLLFTMSPRLKISPVVGMSKLGTFCTIGSIVGGVFTSYWGVPILGVSNLLKAWGLTLTLLALAFIRVHKRRGALALVVGLFGLHCSIGNLLPDHAYIETEYSSIQMIDKADVRILLMNGLIHTAVNMTSGDSVMPYVSTILAAAERRSKGKEALVLGLGGGSLANALVRSGYRVDAVEIDQAVISLARRHFGLNSQVRVHCADARRYLRECKGMYDLVIVDVLGSAGPPDHLATLEFFAELDGYVRECGVVLVNSIVDGWDSEFGASVYCTLRRVWSRVDGYPTANRDSVGNMVFACSQAGCGYLENASLVECSDIIAKTPGIVLTDDRGSAAWLYRPVAVAYQDSVRRSLQE